MDIDVDVQLDEIPGANLGGEHFLAVSGKLLVKTMPDRLLL
jgi:hypothetical protein